MTGAQVKLLGCWASPYTLRVKWALKLKGIEYEYQEEDLQNKSPLLLQSNPVHQKTPVLLHNGKPIAESLVILEYIDDVWKQNPLLTEDPYERAKARFWAKFVDEKCVPTLINVFIKVGEEQERSVEEAREHMKTLESGLDEKCYFGEEKIGFVDVAADWIGYWAQMTEKIVGAKLIDEETTPSLVAWFHGVLEDPNMKECLPPYEKLLERNKGFRKALTADAVASQ